MSPVDPKELLGIAAVLADIATEIEDDFAFQANSLRNIAEALNKMVRS